MLLKLTPYCLQCSIWLAVLYTLSMQLENCNASTIGNAIADQLTIFANDGLGIQAFQDYLDDELTFTNENLDAGELAREIGETMSSKLRVRIEALTGLKQGIEEAYGSVTSNNPYQQCCTIPVYEKDPLLNTEVNKDTWCVIGQSIPSASEFLPNSVLQTLKQQYQMALGIKYAYFASAEGVMFNYPGLRVCDESYDARFRPWYVESSTPKPKDIVIVIDKSGSMSMNHAGQTLMTIAKNAANTVIETLNPNDRVGIVAFSTDTDVPSGTASTSDCFQTLLAKATSQNKDYLKQFVTGINHGGQTYYEKALRKAFQYFVNTPVEMNDTRDRDKVILFLTDGVATESDKNTIYNRISTENRKLNNSVIILTYGLGNSVAADVLIKMKDQISNNAMYGETKAGVYTHVSDPSDLRSAMASYYEQFKQEGVPQVIFSAPYIDKFGSGLLISMCLPVNYQNVLKGVTCMDLSVDDMLSEITYFQEGEKSYAFIIDHTSRILTHPLIAFASEITDNPYFIYLNSLEAVPGIEDITNSMKSGNSGTRVVGSSVRITPRGNVKLEGILKSTQSSTYSWYPVAGTTFSVCLVIGQGDQRASLQWSGPYPSYLYHRTDLITDNLDKCRQFTRASVRDQSSVAFSARCFNEPFEYLNTPETGNTLNGYEVYLTGVSNNNPGFRDGIREMLAATGKFDELLNSRADWGKYTVWRYVGTDNGIFRIWPAVELPKAYDATRRTWYLRSKAHKGMCTISTPYEDAFGAGTVVTLSKAIFEGNSGAGSHSSTDKTLGVIGMDFTIQYFYYIVTEQASQCQTYTCFIVDQAGFIVVHKNWIETSGTEPDREEVHISEFEPYIASQLVSSNVMEYDGCVNIEQLQNQYFWNLYSAQDIINNNFELHIIPGTNVYLIIRKRGSSASCNTCDAYTYCAYNFKNSDCFCPCKEKADIYKYCEGNFDFSGDTLQPCTPPAPSIDFSNVALKDASLIRGLATCYDYSCGTKTTASECNSVLTCQWCEYDENYRALDTPVCSNQTACPWGRMYSGSDGSAGAGGGGGGFKWWIIVIVLVLIVAAAAVAVIVYVKFFKASKPPAPSVAPSTRDPPTAPPAQNFTNLGYVNEPPPAYGDVHPNYPPYSTNNTGVYQ